MNNLLLHVIVNTRKGNRREITKDCNKISLNGFMNRDGCVSLLPVATWSLGCPCFTLWTNSQESSTLWPGQSCDPPKGTSARDVSQQPTQHQPFGICVTHPTNNGKKAEGLKLMGGQEKHTGSIVRAIVKQKQLTT